MKDNKLTHADSESSGLDGRATPGGLDGAVEEALVALLDNATARLLAPGEDFAIICNLGDDLRDALAALTAERDALRDALARVFLLVEDGTLVRDTSRDHEPDFSIRQIPFVMALRNAQDALALSSVQPAQQPSSATEPPVPRRSAKSDASDSSSSEP